MLPSTRGSDPVGTSLHCSYSPPNTTVTWHRGSTLVTSGNTRTIHDNGTLEFHPLIANVDLTPEGVEYHCTLSNAFGGAISRTAILQLASKLLYIYIYIYIYTLRLLLSLAMFELAVAIATSINIIIRSGVNAL